MPSWCVVNIENFELEAILFATQDTNSTCFLVVLKMVDILTNTIC